MSAFPFDVVVFDLDGTPVRSRRSAPTPKGRFSTVASRPSIKIAVRGAMV
jgi:hypothetical protein